MDIANQLQLLQTIKTDLKTAILAKGGTINDDTPFSEYAQIIQSLEGKENNPSVIKDNINLTVKDSMEVLNENMDSTSSIITESVSYEVYIET